jgi:hypothetical protein
MRCSTLEMRKDLLKASQQSNDGESTGHGHLLVREILEGFHLSMPTPNEVQYLLQSHSPLDKLVDASTVEYKHSCHQPWYNQ